MAVGTEAGSSGRQWQVLEWMEELIYWHRSKTYWSPKAFNRLPVLYVEVSSCR